MKKSGFTLIELLIVIAVIALLAAILFPVFGRARERARATHCINNLRQIGVAVQQYCADWDDVYPYAWGPTAVRSGLRPAFRHVMADYTTDDRMWQCSSDTGETFVNDDGLGFSTRTQPFWHETMSLSSYGYLGTDIPQNYGRLSGYPTSLVTNPVIGPLVFELRPWHETHRVDPSDNIYYSSARKLVLYCDGHVAMSTHRQWQDDSIRAIW